MKSSGSTQTALMSLHHLKHFSSCRNRGAEQRSQREVCSWLRAVHARGPHVCVQLSGHRRNSGGGAPQPPAGVHAPERRPPPGHAAGSHHRHVGQQRQHLARWRRGPLRDLATTRRTEPVRRVVLGSLSGTVHGVQ